MPENVCQAKCRSEVGPNILISNIKHTILKLLKAAKYADMNIKIQNIKIQPNASPEIRCTRIPQSHPFWPEQRCRMDGQTKTHETFATLGPN